MQLLLTTPSSRWVPFVAIGSACIVAGGLVAAITATSPSEHGAWAAAYLVLGGGPVAVAYRALAALVLLSIPVGLVLVRILE